MITAKDVDTIYELPLVFHGEGLDDQIVQRLNIWTAQPDARALGAHGRGAEEPRAAREDRDGRQVRRPDRVVQEPERGARARRHRARRGASTSSTSTPTSSRARRSTALRAVDGILVPHGFGSRGAEGKIQAIQFAREHEIPYFGICYGLQMAVVESARNLGGLAGANSTEVDPKTPHPVIMYMKDQSALAATGGTMRLGSYPCRVAPDTLAARAYGKTEVFERHRHRLEVNPEYHQRLTRRGARHLGHVTRRNAGRDHRVSRTTRSSSAVSSIPSSSRTRSSRTRCSGRSSGRR